MLKKHLFFLTLNLLAASAMAGGLTNEQKEALKSQGISEGRIEQIETAAELADVTYSDDNIQSIIQEEKANPETQLSAEQLAEVEASYQGEADVGVNPSELLAQDQRSSSEWGFASSKTDKIRIMIHTDWVKGKTGQYFEVYLNGNYQWSGWTSLGKEGKFMPQGSFTLKGRDKDHWSSTYNSPMPYYHRLASAWGIHETPHETMLGQRASMGCTRISRADAKRLWELTTGAEYANVVATYLPSGTPRTNEPSGTPPYIAYAKYNAAFPGKGGVYFHEVPSQYQPSASSAGSSGGIFGGIFRR